MTCSNASTLRNHQQIYWESGLLTEQRHAITSFYFVKAFSTAILLLVLDAGLSQESSDSKSSQAQDLTPSFIGVPHSGVGLVTLDNWESSQTKLRWAMRHMRELFPTQAVQPGPPRPLVAEPIGFERFQFSTGDAELGLRACLEHMNADALVVLQNGKLVAEEYLAEMTPESPHYLASVSKSIVSSVVASLLNEERLAEDAVIDSYVPELSKTPYAGATLRQILDMQSAVEYDYTDVFVDNSRAVRPDAQKSDGPVGEREFLLAMQPRDGMRHGDSMLYKESDPSVLVWAAENVTGKRFADLASERLWRPVGAEHPLEAVCDSRGNWTFHLSATARDLARWFQMILDDGRFAETQVVPRSFIQDIRDKGNVRLLQESPVTGELFPEGVGYRSFFYRDTLGEDSIAAVGAYGQMCYASPAADVVIVLLSTGPTYQDRKNAGLNDKEAFAADIQLEAFRWDFCRSLCKFLDQQ